MRVLVRLQVSPSLLQGAFPADRLHDTVTFRGGAEWRPAAANRSWRPAARFGLAWEPSPIAEQVLLTSYADNDRLLLTAGGGIEILRLPGLIDTPVSVDASLGWHHLMERKTRKLDPTLADAHYWLGMANLNEGKMPEAATHFEEYLKLAPTGQYAEQAKGILTQIKK